MYGLLVDLHSYLRYIVSLFLIVVIVASVLGWFGKKPYTKMHDKTSLFLLICTHTQALIGIVLYFVSPVVQFGPDTMSNKSLRYWAVEHITGMLIAVVLITAARSTTKKMPVDQDKHKRMALFNTLAFVVIVVVIYLSGRGLL